MKQRAGKLMSGQESLHILPYLIAVFLLVGAVFDTEVMGLGASHFALLILFKTMP